MPKSSKKIIEINADILAPVFHGALAVKQQQKLDFLKPRGLEVASSYFVKAMFKKNEELKEKAWRKHGK